MSNDTELTVSLNRHPKANANIDRLRTDFEAIKLVGRNAS